MPFLLVPVIATLLARNADKVTSVRRHGCHRADYHRRVAGLRTQPSGQRNNPTARAGASPWHFHARKTGCARFKFGFLDIRLPDSCDFRDNQNFLLDFHCGRQRKPNDALAEFQVACRVSTPMTPRSRDLVISTRPSLNYEFKLKGINDSIQPLSA
jgi:hypothetical protein